MPEPRLNTLESEHSDRVADSPLAIAIHGARTHNLKNISVSIPVNQFTVITGVSGSGKSSLAFDTLYAEGQRQYIESLSLHARQFMRQLDRPAVDLIEGLPPTLCLEQGTGGFNPRSTVGTISEVYDYLRILMARVGTPMCYQCGQPILRQSIDEIAEIVQGFPENTKLMILSPVVRGRRGGHATTLAEIARAGLVKVRIDGEIHEIESAPLIDPQQSHTVDAVVDRIVWRGGAEERLLHAIELAVHLSDGLAIVCWLSTRTHPSGAPDNNNWDERLFSTQYSCPRCGISYEEVEPRTFSFNSPYGACPRCAGLGWVAATTKDNEPSLAATLQDDDSVVEDNSSKLKRRADKTSSKNAAAGSQADSRQPCPDCKGARLRKEALAVELESKNIHALVTMQLDEFDRWLSALQLEGRRARLAVPLLREMRTRLTYLLNIGLGYLSLDRSVDTLSGGELQRVRLATSIGSGLVGVCYILDEPSIGLHPRDTQRLIDALHGLREQGNTLVVVEHDEAVMRAADHMIEIGPEAGPRGGYLIGAASPEWFEQSADTPTGRFLRRDRRDFQSSRRRKPDRAKYLELVGIKTNNLQNLTVRIPLGLMVGVAGVSGSGKSSLMIDTLAPAMREHLSGTNNDHRHYQALHGAEQVSRFVMIDQSPIGRSARSVPATYSGVFDEIRNVFVQSRDARQRGFKAGRFSFNTGPGRCEKCLGLGVTRLTMGFLPEVEVACERCHGRRFNRQTLEVKYKGCSIADILEMSIDEALSFFENFAKIERTLTCMQQVGIGYLKLGQSSTTLSGGEAQRIKLATELSAPQSGSTLYLLDEPTTGLHGVDIARLLGVLDGLVQLGNSVMIIEHNPDVLQACDWLIELGPEAGSGGGLLVAEGTPESLAANGNSWTGKFLAGAFK